MLRGILLLAVGLWAASVALIGWQQRRLIYHTKPMRVAPATLGLVGVEELRLPTPDGETIVAWRAKAPPGRPTVLYFHGNDGSLADRAERVRKYQAAGLGLLLMAYRGYSGSTGRPSETANVADARLALGHLLAEGVPIGHIFVYGESLGSGVAVQTAAGQALAGLILDAPYTSLVDVAAGRHPFLPVRLMMIDRYETLAHIGAVRAPLFVVHGEHDEIIPLALGRRVFAAGHEPKEMAVIAGAMHANHYLFGSYQTIFGWIDRQWQARAAAASR